MTTFSLVKLRAYTYTTTQLCIVKKIANEQRRLGLFWAFDASISYINMRESEDKLFWWRMTVMAIRNSNYFLRKCGR